MNKPTGEKKYMNADKNKGVDFLLLLQNQDSKKIINKLAKERKILVNKFKQPKSKTIRIPIELYNDFKKTGNGDIKKGMIKTILLRRAFDPIEYDKKFREKDKKEQLWRYRRDFHKRVLDEVRRLRNE